MSAAATAAGYLYASGRLRGRNAREQEHEKTAERKPEKPAPREKIRVAVYEPEPAAAAPRRVPKIEYRTRRRWSAE